MARQAGNSPGGSWLLVEEFLERGDPAFVDELRRIHDADRLANFAAKWYGTKGSAARSLLLAYLDRPLNAYCHEPLVKRLFKQAEQAGDDEVMGAFLVLFDRSVRRVRRKQRHWDRDANEIVDSEVVRVPKGTTMPRPGQKQAPQYQPRRFAAGSPTEDKRLFTVQTRKYLRRRAWRYFRLLGKKQPDRYIPALAAALRRYTDADAATGLQLIDNWSLMHVLFQHTPALKAKTSHWHLNEGHSLAELSPAPAYEPLWAKSGNHLIDLLLGARCRPVRHWALQMLKRHQQQALADVAVDKLFAWLWHEDPEIVQLATELLHQRPDVATIPVERWLKLLEKAQPETLDAICDVMVKRLPADRVDLTGCVDLACSRPLPIARLGEAWLRGRTPTSEADCRQLLRLTEAEAVPVRPALVRWARATLRISPWFTTDWVLEYLDSRHEDVRQEGWLWLEEDERAANDVRLWQRLLESPYDDIRLKLVGNLESRVAAGPRLLNEQLKLDADLVRYLWAAVLLNIQRGSRSKPVVVQQMVQRLQKRPDETTQLLPILGVALRSARGPEWRAGLAGLVNLIEQRPDVRPLVLQQFPELACPAEERP